MVTENAATQIRRVTTEQADFLAATTSVNADLYETYGFTIGSYWREYPAQVLRYHVMSFQPGQVQICNDGTGNTCSASCTCVDATDPLNADYAKLLLWDLRKKDKVLEW